MYIVVLQWRVELSEMLKFQIPISYLILGTSNEIVRDFI